MFFFKKNDKLEYMKVGEYRKDCITTSWYPNIYTCTQKKICWNCCN